VFFTIPTGKEAVLILSLRAWSIHRILSDFMNSF